jgi:hypothetical protein
VAIVKTTILNEEVMVDVVHKLEVKVIIMEMVKVADDHLNLKNMVDNRHLVQKTMLNHHQNKTNDWKQHSHQKKVLKIKDSYLNNI